MMIGLTALVAAVPAASAAGTTRYAAPTEQGTADCSSVANACTLTDAIQNASSADTVRVTAGDYTITDRISNVNADNLSVLGPEPGAGLTRISSTADLFLRPTSLIRDLRFTSTNQVGLVNIVTAGTIERSVIRTTDTWNGSYACAITLAISDSVCQSDNSTGLYVETFDAVRTVPVRNTTAVGGRYGLVASTQSSLAGALGTVDVRNSILRHTGPGDTTSGQAADVYLQEVVFGAETADTVAKLQHSAWESAYAGTGQVQDLGGTITAAPTFVDAAAGDLRVPAGSPTVDAGTTSGLPVGATDVRGLPRTIGSAPDIGAYEFAAPAADPVPSVSGEARQGATLTVDDGTWTPAGAVTLARRWQRCAADGTGCTDISAATGASYVLGADDVGKRVRGVVTGTTADGDASAESAPTAVVAAAPAPTTTTGTTPAPVTTADRTAPAISAGRIAPASFPRRKPSRASFKLSEAATVTFEVERRTGKRWRSVGKPSSRRAPAGKATIRLPRSLPAGSYRLVITAVDAAGNRSGSVRLSFRVR